MVWLPLQFSLDGFVGHIVTAFEDGSTRHGTQPFRSRPHTDNPIISHF